MKQITLQLQGYYITGTADITDWYNQPGCIPMKPFRVKHLKEIPKLLNDSGFGSQSINGAICEIYRDYGECMRHSDKTLTIGQVSEFTTDTHYERE